MSHHLVARLKLTVRWLILPLLLAAPLAAADTPTDPWTAYMTPGETHQTLKQLEGEWQVEASHWMAPGSEPQVFSLSAKNEMSLGNRFLTTRLAGSMAGMPFEEIAHLGFNNTTGRFTRVTLGNFGTGLLVYEGGWKEPARVIELSGQVTMPGAKTPMRVRQTITWVNDEEFVLESYDTGETGEQKTMAYRFTRKTAP